VQSVVLRVISLAQFTITSARAEAIDNKKANSLEVQIEGLEHEIARLREEVRIKDQRMRRVSAHRRPQYKAIERLEILELRTMLGWSLRQTADTFHVAPATVASWMKRADKEWPHALLELREPVNKFPEFVQYAVKRFKTLCSTLGKKKIAEILCRAGLHLAASICPLFP
jgi:predicted RNA polymerase sigma factor